MKKQRLKLVAPAIAFVMICALAVQALSRPTPADTAPYHALIKRAESELKLNFGDWEGQQIKTSGAAYRLLHPNVIFTRKFRNIYSSERVTFLLVHCKDARDINGHYPPVCYPGQGFEYDEGKDASPFDWDVKGRTFTGTEYRFSMGGIDQQLTIVENFILLSDNRIARDMDSVGRRAWDYMKRFYGAAQVQVVFSGQDARLDERRRKEIFQEMVEAHLPVIEAILYGAQNDEQ